MGNKLLFNKDPLTGITTWFTASDDGEDFTITSEMDAAPLVDQNKELFNDAPTRWGDGQRVASIPLNVYYDLKKQGIVDDEKRFKAWLNDPDNRFFRTRPGNV